MLQVLDGQLCFHGNHRDHVIVLPFVFRTDQARRREEEV